MYLYPNVIKLRDLREQKNMSQHELSLKAGLNGNSIYRIEKGICTRTHSLLERQSLLSLYSLVEYIHDG